jgi:murein L,D-transpeptidase YcbB/YkuD
VGPATLRALNVTAEERARQIEVNLERMRWISGNLGSRYLKVNIADDSLDVIEDGRTIMSTSVVVGKPYWHTPVFSDMMTHLVLNPYWNIPQSILKNDLLPKIQRSRGYLAQEGIKVLRGTREINPRRVNWSTADADNFKYLLRQEPGPKNPLGRIKFMFPNNFNVYLHDTPSKNLFSRNVKTFSHGCIRIEKPIYLAEYLLRDDPEWTRGRILAEIETGKRQTVQLPEPVSIHILYLTAWIDKEGILQFRDDVYRRDKSLLEAIRKKPAKSSAGGT